MCEFILFYCSGSVKEFENDNSLVLTQSNHHYGVATKFPTLLDSKNQDLVIQYELKLEETLNCGGAYLKLLRSDVEDVSSLNNDTPYVIMFGPDKCGSSNKVHFIVQHQNPLTKTWEEKHYNQTIAMRPDKKVHIYTIHIKNNDNSFVIYTDLKESNRGNLFTHMKPPINPPEEIDDPTDFKPSTWVDDEMIDDPDAVKPDDWDESQPEKIPDPEAKRPDNWLVDGPLEIPDPTATKPEDWDDDQDGEYEQPTIPNPDCEKFGCGEWTAPLIKNPLYKGIWKAPIIKNPKFIGKWQAKKIKNKDYFVDPNPANFPPISGIAIEVWTVNGGIAFDNIVISNSFEAVTEFSDVTFKLKSTAEKDSLKKDQKEKKEKTNKSSKKVSKKSNLTFQRLKSIKSPADAAALLNDVASELVVVVKTIVQYSQENPLPLVACLLAFALSLLVLIPSNKKKPIKVKTTSDSGSSETSATSTASTSGSVPADGNEPSSTSS